MGKFKVLRDLPGNYSCTLKEWHSWQVTVAGFEDATVKVNDFTSVTDDIGGAGSRRRRWLEGLAEANSWRRREEAEQGQVAQNLGSNLLSHRVSTQPTAAPVALTSDNAWRTNNESRL